MTTPAAEFKKWMDEKNLRAHQVNQRFGVSEQTIAHWRSKGVPETRIPHVNYVISCWSNWTAPELGSRLLISPTAEQFRAWNQAALDEGLLLEQWAIESSDRLAGEREDKTDDGIEAVRQRKIHSENVIGQTRPDDA